jgi:hypothetical protein
MPIFFIASGPALALLARRSEWRSHRQQLSLQSQFGSVQATPAQTRRDAAGKARNRGDASKS